VGPGRVKTPMREVDTSFLKKRILQFGGASVSVLASLHLRRNHLLVSCSTREFSHGLGQTRPSRAIGDMSPIPPITAVMLQRNERQKRASNGRPCESSRFTVRISLLFLTPLQ
jgi:hypothetical protein